MAGLPARQSLTIDGPVGPLEALIEHPRDVDPVGVAVICHPHPLHGGTLQNKVAHTLARAFLHCNMTAVRFNFRGTGNSAGEHDNGVGEVEDVRAVLDYVRTEFGADRPWLSGFSFGAAVSIKAAIGTSLSGLVSIAPAVSRFAADLSGQPAAPWLVLIGDRDELVDVDDTIAWVDSLGPRPEFLVMPGAEHFFHGRLVEMRQHVVDFIRAAEGMSPGA